MPKIGGSIVLDEIICARKILETYKEITVNQVYKNTIIFKLFNKDFALLCPERPESKALILLINDDGFDFPHIILKEYPVNEDSFLPKGRYRIVCLYEAESVVFSIMSFDEKIIDVIERLIKLLSLNRTERNREFQKEFSYYWKCFAGEFYVNVYLSQEKTFSKMNYYCRRYGKGYDRRFIEQGIELSDLGGIDKRGNRYWQEHIEKNVYYIPIIDNREILPPYRGHPWTINHVKNIICGKQIDHISYETYQSIKEEKVATQNIILIFGMQMEETFTCFAVEIKCKNRSNRTLMEKICEDAFDIELLVSSRKDFTFLNNQIGNDIELKGKKVLLIGSGSLGSYFALELIKNGVSHLKIYDGDVLEDENTFRWIFGAFGKGCNKAENLSLLLNWIHPEIHVEAVKQNIDDKILTEEAKLFDMIIFSVGNTDSQMRFNRVLKLSNCNIPVFYSWIEAGGEYSHILMVDYGKQGCYQCLYTDKLGGFVNNRTNLNNEGVNEKKIIRNGCGGTRAAYGTAVLLRTTAVLLDLIKKFSSGKINGTTLIDITPENIIHREDVIPMERCGCCGNINEQLLREDGTSES